MEDFTNDRRVLGEYETLLRFRTVGADPARLKDCADCAMWLRAWLKELGFAVELALPPPGTKGVPAAVPPVVLAERKGTGCAPSILFYGHYDVQPPDPLEQWETPPFEPTLKETASGTRMFARGAQDDKGQFFAFFCGMRDFLEERARSGAPVPDVKIVLDGQEESGSAALAALAPSIASRLRADVMLVCDTSAAAGLRPAIVAGLRGVSHFTFRLSAASHDLHSGEYGGIAPNPAQGIAELVASLHAADGSISVPGFLDGIEEPTARERAEAERAAMTDAEYERVMGCPPSGGEAGLTPTERNSFRPTIEVNGIHTGYGGSGSKTVIPADAIAKISMRLVPGQNPGAAMDAVRRHLEGRVPRGMKLSIEDVTGEAAGFRIPLDSPAFRLASAVLGELDGRGAVFQWDGASIPVVSELHRVSGAAPLIVGFGQPEDRIHSPNESFGAGQFAMCRTWALKILSALSD